MGAYLLAKVNIGPAYVGGSFGYISADNIDTLDKDETGPQTTTQWSPGIIFGDANYRTWVGSFNPGGANNSASFDALNKQNNWAYNAFGGINITPKLNIDAQVWLLQADQKKYWDAAGVKREAISADYGTEMDITATYKIYDNLSYMVGAGYFLTGDYFKGTSSANKNEPLPLPDKLTLKF